MAGPVVTGAIDLACAEYRVRELRRAALLGTGYDADAMDRAINEARRHRRRHRETLRRLTRPVQRVVQMVADEADGADVAEARAA